MTQIYLHGLGQTPASWEETIAKLKSAERAVCPDLTEMLRGKEAAYQNLYDAFSGMCGAYGERTILCGLSLGGVLVLNYAIEHPEKVNSLVLVAAQYKMPKRLLKVQNILFQFMPKSMFKQTGVGKKEFIQLCGSMMELDFSNSIQEVTCPTFVVCGDRDSSPRIKRPLRNWRTL